MNANELVERTVELLDEARECFQAANPYLTDEESKLFKKDYEYYDALLYALSATIPRETEVQKPTEADTDRMDQILAYNTLGNVWQITGILNATKNKYYRSSVECDLYPFWLPMPQSPTAEGEEDVR